jgi:hypothetical protein
MGLALKGFIALASVLVLFLVWVATARYIALFVDRIKTVSLQSLPTTPFSYEGSEEGGTFQIGDLPMRTQGPNYDPFPLRISPDSQNRLVLSMTGRSFLLAAEPGDETSFIVERGLSWPTPFDFNFMTGQSPSWRRHLYYVLRWNKKSGSKLKMVWRYEQYFYNVWTSGFMTREGSTGLIRVELSP